MLTVLSMIGGGLMRFLPELMNFLNRKTDNQHELDMMNLQIQMEQLHQVGNQAQIDSNQVLAMLDAQKSALDGQMQKTGFVWIDALNFLVRPLTTYYFLICYGIVKTAKIAIACQTATPWAALVQCWDEEDASIMCSILAFWFVGRVFDKAKQ